MYRAALVLRLAREAVKLLEARCVGCHNGATRQSGLDLSRRTTDDVGLDQDALNYLHQGRRERLTEIQGEVIKGIV